VKKRILFLLTAIIMATQCACAVPAELQGLTEEEIFSAIQSIAASYEADENTAEEDAYREKKAEKAADAVEAKDDVEQTVDQIIAAYNSDCIAVSAPAKESDVYHPVSIVQYACYDGDCYMVYPQVQDAAGAELINSTICEKVVEQAAILGVPVLSCYKVEYNRNGIFSLRMLLYDLYGDFEKYLACVPLTFNVETGELYSLKDFFNSEDQSWRGRIPDIITTQAADSNMVLLSDIMPVADDQPFYITDEAVVITYDLYEIATYSAGEPEFEIAVGELAEYIAPDGILNVFLSPTPTVEATAEPTQTPEPEATPQTPVPEETEAPVDEGDELLNEDGELAPDPETDGEAPTEPEQLMEETEENVEVAE